MGIACKVFPITTIKRSRIYNSISHKKNEIFNINAINEHVENCVKKGITNFSEIFFNIDLTTCIKCDSKINQFFDCVFINGNYAWVSVENGHYRYFTKSKMGICHGLDFIDLFSIYFNTDRKRTLININNMFGFSFDDKWRIEQKKKYENNKLLLKNNDFLLRYPKLYSLIKKHIDILYAMNEIGNTNLMGRSLQYNNQAIFFSSTTYVKNNHNVKYSTSVINQFINLLSVLGLIVKVKEDYIPTEYLFMSKNRMKIDKCRYNHVSFYTLPNMSDVLSSAEDIANVLVNNNIKYYKISRNVVSDLFGEEFADEIYVQKIYRGTSKIKNKKLSDEMEKIKHYFNISVIENGFVSKEILKRETNMNGKKFNKLWVELINNTEHFKVKPNKIMKKKYNLSTNENVIIIREKYKSHSWGY